MSAFRVELGPAAAKAFAALDPVVRDRIRKALQRLAVNVATPGRVPGNAVKTIKGVDDTFHRLRVGDYRVMYDLLTDDRTVLVLGIVHRGELERWLRRR